MPNLPCPHADNPSRRDPWSHGCMQVVELTSGQLRARLDDALAIYVCAMDYAPGTEAHRAPMWLEHMLRPGWRCVGAFAGPTLVGIGYGYLGAPGQWWHDEVRRGLDGSDPTLARTWTSDYFELTELHVTPDCQGNGIGGALITLLLSGVEASRVMLSTPEGSTRAFRLYERTGFTPLLRNHHFTGDPRPFAVLGRALPL